MARGSWRCALWLRAKRRRRITQLAIMAKRQRQRKIARYSSGTVEHLLKANNTYGALRMVSLPLPLRAFKTVQGIKDLLAFAQRMQGHAKARKLRVRALEKIGRLPPELRAIARLYLGVSP